MDNMYAKTQNIEIKIIVLNAIPVFLGCRILIHIVEYYIQFDIAKYQI